MQTYPLGNYTISLTTQIIADINCDEQMLSVILIQCFIQQIKM